MKYKTIIGNTLVLEKLSENGKKKYTLTKTLYAVVISI